MSALSFPCKSIIFAHVVVTYKRGKWALSGHVWVRSSRTDKMISLPSLKDPHLHLETWSAPWSSPHWSWSGLLRLTRVAGLTWPTAWRASGVWQGSVSHVGRALASSPSRSAWRRGRWRWSIFFQTPTTHSLWRLWTACRSCCPTRGSTPRSTCRPTCLVSWKCRNSLTPAHCVCKRWFKAEVHSKIYINKKGRANLLKMGQSSTLRCLWTTFLMFGPLYTSSNNAVLISPLCSLYFQNRKFFDVCLEIFSEHFQPSH